MKVFRKQTKKWGFADFKKEIFKLKNSQESLYIRSFANIKFSKK
ncbi:hypothetical protein HMPREF9176_1792 [Streptococcus downei F0415]|nr:hypothetical protein HMPREF9176_1792 [Streptococcus downei F0415]